MAPKEGINTLQTDDDLLNLSLWLQIYHPDFLNGSPEANMRFLVWLAITSFQTVILVLVNAEFVRKAIDDGLEV